MSPLELALLICFLILTGMYIAQLVGRKELEAKCAKFKESADNFARLAKDAVKEADRKQGSARPFTIQSYQYEDPEFQKVIADIATKPEWQFFLADMKAGIMDAIIMASNDELAANAVGKLKGVSLIEQQLAKIVQVGIRA